MAALLADDDDDMPVDSPASSGVGSLTNALHTVAMSSPASTSAPALVSGNASASESGFASGFTAGSLGALEEIDVEECDDDGSDDDEGWSKPTEDTPSSDDFAFAVEVVEGMKGASCIKGKNLDELCSRLSQ